MPRPREMLSKVADVFGVSRQAVHKWMRKGAPFDSAEALLHWLNNQPVRALDAFHPRCPDLLNSLKGVMEYDRDAELAVDYDVPLETIGDWRRRGAPMDDPDALTEWAMGEPEIFEGFTRTENASYILEEVALDEPELADEIREAVAAWRASPTRRVWRKQFIKLLAEDCMPPCRVVFSDV